MSKNQGWVDVNFFFLPILGQVRELGGNTRHGLGWNETCLILECVLSSFVFTSLPSFFAGSLHRVQMATFSYWAPKEGHMLYINGN